MTKNNSLSPFIEQPAELKYFYYFLNKLLGCEEACEETINIFVFLPCIYARYPYKPYIINENNQIFSAHHCKAEFVWN